MKKLACLLLGLVLYSCAIENNGETDKLENEKATFELLDFTEVPSNIKDIVSGTSKALRERKPTDKDSGEFGAIIEASVHKVSRENGEAYYTFAMERTSDNLVDMDNMVITRDSLGNFSGNIVRYEQREGEYSADYSRYTGKVKIYDGQGTLIVASDLENGRPVADKQGNESGKGSNTCILIDIIEAGTEINGQFYRTEPLRYVYACHEDGFEGENEGGSGGSGNDNGQGSGGGGSPKKTVSIVPNTTCQPGYTKDKNGNCVEEDKINVEIDNPCVAEIINKANIENNSIADLITILFAGETDFDLNYFSGTNIDNDNNPNTKIAAKTSIEIDSNGNLTEINTTFDNDYLSKATDLSIYSTVVHENVHALFYALAETGVIDSNDGNGLLSELATSYAKYKAEKMVVEAGVEANATNLSFFHHEAMVELVDLIKNTIKKYALKKNYENDDFYYEALAWGGLYGTISFSSMDEEIQQLIEDINENEDSGFEILALGKPCKN